MAYTALERSDNARVRKFAPCANLTNLKEAIVSKKENITNSERTGKKDNVSDPVFRSNRQRESTRSPFADWSERRDSAPGGMLERRAFPPLFNPYAGNFPLNLFYMLFDFDGYLI